MIVRGHYWRSKGGRPWSLRVRSDACAKCGGTPDSHPPEPSIEQVNAMLTGTPRYRWTPEGMLLDANGPYVLMHMFGVLDRAVKETG